MITILAHHLELHHVGIALLLFGVGSSMGWMGCSRWLLSKTQNQPLS